MKSMVRRLDPEQFEERSPWLERYTNPAVNVGPFYPFTDRRPITEGWFERVEREGALAEERIDISRIEAVPFHEDGEALMSGEEMLRRAADAENFLGCQDWGQHQAEQLLAQASELPVEMRQFVLVFPDTRLVSRHGSRRVAVLVWDGGCWRLSWGCRFDRVCRFLRLRK